MIRKLLLFVRCLFYMPVNLVRKNKVGRGCHIQRNVFLKNTSVGNYSYIGSYCDISYASIGNYTCIANGVVIGGMEHPYWDLSISPTLSSEYKYGGKTYIGNDVWIATGCIIKQGVKIGNGSIIGANSFVTKDVPPYSIVFGTPAKVHKYRFDEKLIKKIQESEYWKYSPKNAKAILNELRIQMHE